MNKVTASLLAFALVTITYAPSVFARDPQPHGRRAPDLDAIDKKVWQQEQGDHQEDKAAEQQDQQEQKAHNVEPKAKDNDLDDASGLE